MGRHDEGTVGKPRGQPARSLPEQWLGVFKTIDDVPDRYRLANFESEFEGRDPFDRYLDTRDDLSDFCRKQKHGKAYRDFKSHMQERGRHPALPTPAHVESFFERVKAGEWSHVDERTLTTCYTTYLNPLRVFFEWVVHSAEFAHVYDPLLMAAARDGVTRDVWLHRVDRDKQQWQEMRDNE